MRKDMAADGQIKHVHEGETNGHPKRTVIFFWYMLSKIETVPENPGRMVTLV